MPIMRDESGQLVNRWSMDEVKKNDIVYLQLTNSLAKDLKYILEYKETRKMMARVEEHKADYDKTISIILDNLNKVIKPDADV